MTEMVSQETEIAGHPDPDQSLVPASRESIVALEESIMELPDAIGEDELREKLNCHYFASGVYGRTMFIPEGLCVVGKIHKHDHINVIPYGKIKVVTEFSEEVFIGPKLWISKKGTKRAVYALKDTLWLTVHANPDNLDDVKALEDVLTSKDFDEYDALKLGGDL